MSSIFKILAVLMFLSVTSEVMAVSRIVNSTSNDANTVGTLPYWLLNADDGDVIDCTSIAGQQITLTSSLPAITKSYTIMGAGITIDGNNTYQAFQVATGVIVIDNINVKKALSKGGNGGNGFSGGGGAVGGGGALYIHGNTTVTLIGSSLLNNNARGGDGGSADNSGNGGGGGGGGFSGGKGGAAFGTIITGGGGGGHSNGGNGGTDDEQHPSLDGSDGVYFGGGGAGAGHVAQVPGGNGGKASPTGAFAGGAQSGGNGGGGAGDSQDGFSATGTGTNGVPGNGGNGIGDDFLFGGGGGGGSSIETSASGGTGGIGIGAAGGGGGFLLSGGAGGVLGGGGGGGGVDQAVGGEGGFGSGGGGANTGGIGGGGFGAGGGDGGSDPNGNGGGGGGSGLGGAIYIQSNSTLTIIDAKLISGNGAVAGIGGASTGSTDPDYTAAKDGAAKGQDIFVREQGTIIFNLSNTLNIATPIQGDQTNGPNTSGGLQKIGDGVLNLNGANTYSGLTTVHEGTLNLNGSVIGNAVVGSEGTLSGNAAIQGTLNSSGVIHVDINSSGGTSLVAVTGGATLAGTLEIALNSNAQPQTYTVLTSPAIAGTFSAVTFTGTTPVNYSVSYQPGQVQFNLIKLNGTNVIGNGTIAGSSSVITFNVRATYNSQNQIVADMFYNDPGARVHFDNPVVTRLTFNGNSVTLSGTTRVQNQRVTFAATVTGGNPGTLSVSMSNGYSASGNLTSGRILAQ